MPWKPLCSHQSEPLGHLLTVSQELGSSRDGHVILALAACSPHRGESGGRGRASCADGRSVSLPSLQLAALLIPSQVTATLNHTGLDLQTSELNKGQETAEVTERSMVSREGAVGHWHAGKANSHSSRSRERAPQGHGAQISVCVWARVRM